MDLQDIKQNMSRRILQYAVPSIIAMVMTSLITVADGFFIGNYVGKDGIAAVNLGLPVIYLFLAMGLMIGVGGIAIGGIAFGAGEKEKCRSVFNQTVVTAAVLCAATAVLVSLCFEPLLSMLGAAGDVAVYFRQYYRILIFELPIMVLNSTLAMFIRGEGQPALYMKINTINVVLNIFLDYLFTRWFGWGVQGIAAASLVSALAALLLIVRYFAVQAEVYRFARFKTWRFSGAVLKSTVLNGSSEFIGEMSSCIAMFSYNLVIMRTISIDGVAAFTVVGYVAYVFSMILIGFGQGMVPLVGFACGAQDFTAARCLRKRTNMFVLLCSAVTMLLMILCAGRYASLFVKSGSVARMVQSGMKIFVLSLPLSAVNTITSFYFTSKEKALQSAVISSARGLVILLVCIFTLPRLWGMTGVWLVSPVTETVTLLITAAFILSDSRRISFVSPSAGER